MDVRVDKDTIIKLEKCPHVLIGGSTGSGKSYLIKNMLEDILLSNEAMVIVLDPKSVDYQFLENARPLEWETGKKNSEGLTESDIVKEAWLERGIVLMDRNSIDSFEALGELKLLVKEMYRRYSVMKQLGYIDWGEYMKAKEDGTESFEYDMGFGDKRIVLIVDELADLIYWDRQKNMERLIGYETEKIGNVVSREDAKSVVDENDGVYDGTEREVEDLEVQYGVYALVDSAEWKMLKGNIEGSLIKLSILGRAAGIHLVLGTQRPDATVLSGQLRANLPCRICLRVSNKNERRIILGDSGRGNEREMKYLSKDYTLGWDLR